MAKHHAKTKKEETEKRAIKNPNNVIFIKVQKDLIKINLQDIFTIDGVFNTITGLFDDVTIATGKKKYKALITSRELMKKLPESDFIRIQRFCIVRIDKITAIKDNVCTINNREIPVARRLRAPLKSRLTII